MTDTASGVRIIIVGAGPVGLLIALRLARAGIKTSVFEKDAALSSAPRAAGYYGGSLISLARAGVLEKMQATGCPAVGLSWRKSLVSTLR